MTGIITMSLDSLVNLTLGQLVGAELYAYPAGNLAAANYYRRLFGAEAWTGV
jgi:hypothetical protein